MTLRIAVCVFGLLFGCAHPPPEISHPRFIDMTHVDDSIVIDMRYAGHNNFVGERINGYSAPRCLLTEPTAQALAKVQRTLAAQGYSLAIYDCYRQRRAVEHFMRWAEDHSDTRTKPRYYPNLDKTRLFELGYIAYRSSHSRGSTVDVALMKRGPGNSWALVDMGTEYDLFNPSSNTESKVVSSTQRENRLLLRNAMEHGGFENFPKEW